MVASIHGKSMCRTQAKLTTIHWLLKDCPKHGLRGSQRQHEDSMGKSILRPL